MTTLARRVSWASILAACIAACAGAVSAGALCSALLTSATDERLMAVAGELARDLSSADSGRFTAIVAHEADEETSMGITLTVYRDESFVAGDPRLPIHEMGCVSANDRRSCVVAPDWHLRVLAASSQPQPAGLFAGAILGAGLLASLLASLLGRILAKRALTPLARLGEQVGAVRAGEKVQLGPAEGVAEIDELRATIATSMTKTVDALARAERFAASAAHELRTPLTSLRGELELYLEERPNERITIALRKAEQLEALTERLLVLALPERADPGYVPVSLRDVVDEVVAALPPTERARVTLLGHDEGLVHGDEHELSIVVSNGLSNALKFASQVVVELVVSESQLRLSIDDDGPGVPESERDDMFTAFTRGARVGAIRGQGLGLALVAHVMRRHGGSASLETSVRHPHGARLVVALPLLSS